MKDGFRSAIDLGAVPLRELSARYGDAFDDPELIAYMHRRAELVTERSLNLAEAMEARGFGRTGATRMTQPPWGPLELSPRDAFLGAQEVVPFGAAEGRIAAESLAAYPPGVPNVLPGERLTAATIAYITDSLDHGGLVRGASDRSLKTIHVVSEDAGSEDGAGG